MVLAEIAYPYDMSRCIGRVTLQLANKQEAVQRILSAIDARNCHIFAFCNMHTFNIVHSSPEFAAALEKMTLYNDGLGIDIASWILFGKIFPENLNGTDLTPMVLRSLRTPAKVALIGGLSGVAEQAAQVIEGQYPGVKIVACYGGYFEPEDGGQIANAVRDAGAELVLVAMGNPRQELWARDFAGQTGAVVLCVGAFLDFVSGRFQRAPRIIRAVRCEWLFRLVQEPRRLTGRYIGGALPFFKIVLAEIRARHRPRPATALALTTLETRSRPGVVATWAQGLTRRHQ